MGLINDVVPVQELMDRIVAEAEQTINNVQKTFC